MVPTTTASPGRSFVLLSCCLFRTMALEFEKETLQRQTQEEAWYRQQLLLDVPLYYCHVVCLGRWLWSLRRRPYSDRQRRRRGTDNNNFSWTFLCTTVMLFVQDDGSGV